MTLIQNPQGSPLPLTYCMNVHPISKVSDLYGALKSHTLEVKKLLFPNQSMGLGLWFPESLVQHFKNPDHLSKFQEFLKEKDFFVFTMNGFPQTLFHSPIVKENVYFPTWAESRRLEYSCSLATILAQLLPKFMKYGSISTLPLYFKETKNISLEKVVQNLWRLVAFLYRLKEETGSHIVFCIEPEPLCALERTEEVIDFFKNHLLASHSLLPSFLQCSPKKAESILFSHLGVCFDTCHQAVQFEDPIKSLEKLQNAGILVGKVQLSNAIEFHPRKDNWEKLIPFAEDRYLHQVIGRDQQGKLHQTKDLGLILDHSFWKEMECWRIHFHIPIFCDTFSGFHSTLDEMKKSLHFFCKSNLYTHLEVETYTWEILPKRTEILAKKEFFHSLARELEFVLKCVKGKNSS